MTRPRTVVVATRNAGKAQEFARMLSPTSVADTTAASIRNASASDANDAPDDEDANDAVDAVDASDAMKASSSKDATARAADQSPTDSASPTRSAARAAASNASRDETTLTFEGITSDATDASMDATDAYVAAIAAVEWLDLSAFPDAGDVEETGHTFTANACLKATEYARRTGHWTLSDDSGLEVDALDGAPGVYSARFAAMNDKGSGDAANNALLLDRLRDTPDERRTARFVCVLALADPHGRLVLTARDGVEGRILRTARGTNGFGYDPLFEVAPGRSMAELSPAEKADVGHRGRALRRLRSLLPTAWPAGDEG